jgi:hypothetical protein
MSEKKLRIIFQRWPVERLVLAVTHRRAEYRPEVVSAMLEELSRRGVKPEQLSTLPPVVVKKKTSISLAVATTCLVLSNICLGYSKGRFEAHNVPYALGGAMASLFVPILVALVFSIAKPFRNARARTMVILWTSALIFVGSYLNYVALILWAWAR